MGGRQSLSGLFCLLINNRKDQLSNLPCPPLILSLPLPTLPGAIDMQLVHTVLLKNLEISGCPEQSSVTECQDANQKSCDCPAACECGEMERKAGTDLNHRCLKQSAGNRSLRQTYVLGEIIWMPTSLPSLLVQWKCYNASNVWFSEIMGTHKLFSPCNENISLTFSLRMANAALMLIPPLTVHLFV